MKIVTTNNGNKSSFKTCVKTCRHNFWKILKYVDAPLIDRLQLQGMFLDPETVRICTGLFPSIRYIMHFCLISTNLSPFGRASNT